MVLLCNNSRKPERKGQKNSMFGNNAFAPFQSQALEDKAVSQKSHPKNEKTKGKNLIEKLCAFTVNHWGGV